MKGVSIDWDFIVESCRDGRLLDVLAKIPQERWGDVDVSGSTLLHYASFGQNLKAAKVLIKSKMIDINARKSGGFTPVISASFHLSLDLLQILFISGANVTASDNIRLTPLHHCLRGGTIADDQSCSRFLLANGVRSNNSPWMNPKLHAFEQGVLACRTATIAMLRVKRLAKLWNWDRFLLKELAFAIWATRYDDEKWA